MAKHWDSFLSYCIWLRWVMFTRSTSQFFWVRIYYYYYVQSIQLIWKEERKSFFPHYTATSFLPLLCNAYCYVIPPNLLLFGHKLSLCSSLLHFFFRKILFCWGIVYILRKWSLCYWKQNMLQMVNFFLSCPAFPHFLSLGITLRVHPTHSLTVDLDSLFWLTPLAMLNSLLWLKMLNFFFNLKS